jgi:hypothetical protein
MLRGALSTLDAQKTGQRDPRLRGLRAELLLRLGQRGAADELAAALWREGYRDASLTELFRNRS